ncbi:YdcH family protein [Paraglaciecola sp. L1A13]|uniref:YdcH family protein n=1 Tax=Paraglaciecola sp. L1A13 TaxID=2686359 RepID=UPI00131BE9FB|nr:YdcH family protein [Paraglaciecola sp. L1A13]|tara:strand:- start:180 stop:425 length:246 start_codon:yes stop_codon:yes gene_type:complete
MLGENHSLNSDFPEYREVISTLNKSDAKFAEKAKQYDTLDKEIRVLELKDAPIDDETMHQMKHDRAMLKDLLYQRLLSEDK